MLCQGRPQVRTHSPEVSNQLLGSLTHICLSGKSLPRAEETQLENIKSKVNQDGFYWITDPEPVLVDTHR